MSTLITIIVTFFAGMGAGLDVYKRQLMVPIMVQNLMLALVAVADAFMLGGLDKNYMSAVSLATQIPVSYTHLDVYKRQGRMVSCRKYPRSHHF